MRSSGTARRIIALATLALLLAACDRGSEPPSTPVRTATAVAPATATSDASPSPTAMPRVEPVDGLPSGAIGPLVVYREEVDAEQAAGRSWPVLEITTYDLGAERQVAAFRVGGEGNYPAEQMLIGREVLVNLAHSLVAYRLDGSVRRVIAGGEDAGKRYQSALLSADGSLLVFAEFGEGGCGGASVVFVEWASGDELQRVPQTAPGLEGLGGCFPQPAAWRDDGAGVVVRGQPNGHAFFGTATVFVDGTVAEHQLEGSAGALGDIAPNGRYYGSRELVDLWEVDDLGCELSGRLDARALEDNEVLGSVEEAGYVVVSSEWSPNSEELLVELRAAPDPDEGSCTQQFSEWRLLPSVWRLVELGSGDVSQIEDPEEVRGRWVDGDLAWTCPTATELRRFVDMNDRVYARCIDPDGESESAELLLHGVSVGPADRVLGFIKVP